MNRARDSDPVNLIPGRAGQPRRTQLAGLAARTLPRSHLARRLAARPARRHLALLLGYLAAGVALTWPRATYLTGRLPATVDQSSYVWGLWWVAHQVSHLGNPWFTDHLGAPAGVALGFDTLMPLVGVVMTPVTVLFGPSVSYNLLAIVLPGLLCYVMYRLARLWLPDEMPAIVAGALYGLATMLVWQDWYHLNLAAGALFLPLTLEAAVRLARRPSCSRAAAVGLVLGGSVLVNQESAIMAGMLAAAVMLPWLARGPTLAKLRQAALTAAVTALAASPQLAAMAMQVLSGGAAISPRMLARWDAVYGTPLTTLFAPSPRVSAAGLPAIASVFSYAYPAEGIPTFGVALSALAVLGLVVGWRRQGARLLALLWAASAALALGAVLTVGTDRLVPLALDWRGARMSGVLPYTWLVHVPGLAAFREADRFALLGLVPATLLAGNAVAWLRCRARPLLIAALTAAVLEAGYSGDPRVGTIPTVMPALDRPIAADHSGSVVVDVPFGLRGGLAPYGRRICYRALVLATADGHPRAGSYTSWVPASSVAAIAGHPFFRRLNAAESGRGSSRAQLRLAGQDLRRMRVGWVVVWMPAPAILRYLRGTGLRLRYRADGAAVYRHLRGTPGQAGGRRGALAVM
jgi:hypothetical protein